jgi:hypothetical protein
MCELRIERVRVEADRIERRRTGERRASSGADPALQRCDGDTRAPAELACPIL